VYALHQQLVYIVTLCVDVLQRLLWMLTHGWVIIALIGLLLAGEYFPGGQRHEYRSGYKAIGQVALLKGSERQKVTILR